MKRSTILIATLIAVLISSLHTAHAQDVKIQQFNVFMADYRNGSYYAALVNTDGDSVTAIKIDSPQEDIMPAYGIMVTGTIELTDRGYSDVIKMYSTEYNKEFSLTYAQLDESNADHIIGYVNTQNGVTTGTLDGDLVQFTGFVTNGETIKLRSANVLAQVHAAGYLVQNGNLISYVATDKEDRVYTVNLALVLR